MRAHLNLYVNELVVTCLRGRALGYLVEALVLVEELLHITSHNPRPKPAYQC